MVQNKHTKIKKKKKMRRENEKPSKGRKKKFKESVKTRNAVIMEMQLKNVSTKPELNKGYENANQNWRRGERRKSANMKKKTRKFEEIGILMGNVRK